MFNVHLSSLVANSSNDPQPQPTTLTTTMDDYVRLNKFKTARSANANSKETIGALFARTFKNE